MEPMEAFKEYEALKKRIKEDEARMKELQSVIIQYVPEDSKVEGAYGVFELQKRISWKYSPAVDKAVDTVDKLKAQEEADGTATATYKPVLYYRTKKEGHEELN